MARAGQSSGTRGDAIVLAVCCALSLFALVLPSNLRSATAQTMRRTLVAPLVGLQKRAELSRSAFLAHDSAVVIQDSVALQAMSAVALRAENDRLRRLLGLGQALKWGFVPAEALSGGRGAREEFTLTLSQGSNAGIRPFSPVVAPEGLVGMIQTVDPTMSLAIVWPHPDFRVSAMTADGSAFGIVQAHLGDGEQRYLLELRGVPFRTSLKEGVLVVSSGLGGTYPRGIPIGTVLAELRTAEGWARTYLVRPMVLPADIASVMVLRPERVTAGVQNVWALPANVDSAARAVTAAGDSLARRAALAEVEARRAVRDSLAALAPPPAPPTDSAIRAAAADSAARAAAARRRAQARRDSIAAVRRDSAAAAAAAAPPRPTTPPDTTRPPR